MPASAPLVGVVIPCYRVRDTILHVLRGIGPEVSRIYVVDDACSDHTGDRVEHESTDARVTVIRHAVNQGVGGAVMSGYRAALNDSMDIIVKLDGDGQMDPSLIPQLIQPLADEEADYTKGNRFYNPEDAAAMPWGRLIGNAVLSLVTKFSSGYWGVFDPTNGYTAIEARVLRVLPLEKIATRYFFESDMLFRLNTVGAVVWDIPMKARYGSETSHLRPAHNAGYFLVSHTHNFFKRILYNYFLRNMSISTFELVFGILLLGWGIGSGVHSWRLSNQSGIPATSGTVMLAALPIIMGFQMLLAFLAADIASTPILPLAKRLKTKRSSSAG